MRILYLSMSRQEYAENYFGFLRGHIKAVAAPDTAVDLSGTWVGRVDSYRFFEFLDTISIIDQILAAEKDGYDAVAIGNMLDPGLREARSMVDIPVLGLAETCMHVACMMGQRFSLITVNPFFIPRFEENLFRCRLTERMASMDTLHFTPHELDRCFSDPAMRRQGVEGFHQAARNTIAKGAEVIIPAGGRLTAFLTANDIKAVDGVPVLDGVAALLALTESAVRLRQIMGTFVSRQGVYIRPPAKLVAENAAAYSERYGLPHLQP